MCDNDIQVHDAVLEVIEGDARNVLCEAVERHRASMVVVGSRGYGAIKRYFSYYRQISICWIKNVNIII